MGETSVTIACTFALAGLVHAQQPSNPSAAFDWDSPDRVDWQPTPVATVDMNGDGKIDVVVVTRKPKGIAIRLGDGTGRFDVPTTFPLDSIPESMAVADVNGDEKADIVLPDRVILGDGRGGFGASSAIPVSRSLALGDFTGDGVLDLVASEHFGDQIKVLAGSRSGGFSLLARFPGVCGGACSLERLFVADLNGDGKADVLGGHNWPHHKKVTALPGNGAGSLGPVLHSEHELFGTGGMVVGLIDNDRTPDVVVSAGTSQKPFRILLGDGTGRFRASTNFGNWAEDFVSWAIALGDVTGDGKTDVVAAVRTRSEVEVFAGSGGDTVSSPKTFTVSGHPNALAVADVNGDGKLDVVVSCVESGPLLTVLVSDGKGDAREVVSRGIGVSESTRGR